MNAIALAVWLTTAAGTVPVTLCPVHDGDTFRIRTPEGVSERVRVMGIDTPELGASARCPEEAAAAQAAQIVAAALLTRASDVRIVSHRRDRYGRLLGQVWVDGRDFAQILIDAGHGRPYQGGRRAGWCPAR